MVLNFRPTEFRTWLLTKVKKLDPRVKGKNHQGYFYLEPLNCHNSKTPVFKYLNIIFKLVYFTREQEEKWFGEITKVKLCGVLKNLIKQITTKC